MQNAYGLRRVGANRRGVDTIVEISTPLASRGSENPPLLRSSAGTAVAFLTGMADEVPLIAPGGTLSKRLSHPRFVDDSLSVLLLDGDYLLVGDCERALRNAGHRVFRVAVGDDVATLVKTLLWTAVDAKPDFVLSINHIGFDQEGTVGGLLAEIGLPVAVWYVDSPSFVLAGATVPCPELTSVFCWERAWIPELEGAGFDDVEYLPLATDPSIFRPRTGPARYPLSFVGASMQHARKKWQKKVPAGSQGLARAIGKTMLEGERALPHAFLERFAPKLTGKRREDVLALATWNATATYRTELLRALPPEALHLFGDDGWRHLMPRAAFHGSVDYGAALADVYGCSSISLNATSLQMPTAVNQRVFDVPASGGFVLTDHQSDLEELFDPGVNIVTYRSADELVALQERYRRDAVTRESILRAGRARVLDAHTFTHRIDRMIQHLRARHASRARALGSPR